MASSSVLTCQRTIPAEQTKHTARDRIMVNQGLLPIPDPSLKNNKNTKNTFVTNEIVFFLFDASGVHTKVALLSTPSIFVYCRHTTQDCLRFVDPKL